MSFLEYEDGGVVILEDGLGYLLLELGEDVSNPFASIVAPTSKNACERSGFPALPHELVRDEFNDRMVLKEFVDHQDRRLSQMRAFRRSRGPEKKDDTKTERFITTPVTQDDL